MIRLLVLAFCSSLLLSPPGLSACRAQVVDSFWVETFADNQRQWPIVERQQEVSAIREGQLRLVGRSKALPFFLGHPAPGILGSAFRIRCELSQVSGRKNMGFGLVWGARNDRRDHYALLISSNHKFTVLRRERGRYTFVTPWTETDLLRGKKELNQLEVVRIDARYLIFINGQKVYAFPAEPLKGDLLGVILHGKLEIEVDSLAVEKD